MKILHIADIHIGAGNRWWSDIHADSPRYLMRHKACLDEMTSRAVAAGCTHAILAGDILDRPKPTVQEMRFAAAWLLDLADKMEVYVTAGNHEDISANLTVLHAFESLTSHPRLHWRLDIQETDEPWGRTLWCPHHATSQLQDALDQNPDLRFVVAHYAHKGSVFENGYSGVKGWDINYPAHLQQVFLGDIHVRQRLNSAPMAWYPGSPLQLNFGEGGAKGFDIYDTETGQRQQILLKAAAPLLTVDVTKEIPNFLPGAIYRARVARQFIDHDFPENVVSVILQGGIEAPEDGDRPLTNQIDFGDPLAGIERVLDRNKIEPELREDCVAAATEIVRSFN